MEYQPLSEDADSFSIFCLRHRPFPLRKEIERNERLTEDEITHFCELFDNALFEWKNMKRWSEKDKRELLANVTEIFFKMRKLGITLYKDKSSCPLDTESFYIKQGRYFC
jgi:hypothetical protein